MNKLVRSALKTALYLMELSDQASTDVRDRVSDQVDDARDRAQRTYGVVSERVGNAARALRGENNGLARNALVFAGGVGAGLALGVIFAPASGQDTRQAIAQRFEDAGAKIRERFNVSETKRPDSPFAKEA